MHQHNGQWTHGYVFQCHIITNTTEPGVTWARFETFPIVFLTISFPSPRLWMTCRISDVIGRYNLGAHGLRSRSMDPSWLGPCVRPRACSFVQAYGWEHRNRPTRQSICHYQFWWSSSYYRFRADDIAPDEFGAGFAPGCYIGGNWSKHQANKLRCDINQHGPGHPEDDHSEAYDPWVYIYMYMYI